MMAFPGDPHRPTDPAYDPPYADPYNATAPYPTEPAYREYHDHHATRRDVRHDRPDVTREVTAGPYRFGLREAMLGTIGIFAILGLVLGILGFAAAFALDDAAPILNDGNPNNDGLVGVAAIPALLVGLLPFMAAPVLALGLGAWTGHASRDAGLGAVSGALGGFLGPILMLLITGIGFALGAGAANLDLSATSYAWGVAPGWGNTIPYLFTGAGLLWMIANTIAGAATGGLVGGLLEHRWTRDRSYRRAATRPPTRY